MLTKKELINKIKSSSTRTELEYLANELLSIQTPWFFKRKFSLNANAKYNEFREYMSSVFNIKPEHCFIAGSSLLGFSLNPKKNYRNHNEKSDMDIVIINSKSYKFFNDNYFEDYTFISSLYGDNYTKIAKNIFKRFIDFKNNNYTISTNYYKEWEKKTLNYKNKLQIGFDFPEEIGYRIYCSLDDYKKSLIRNIRDLKDHGKSGGIKCN